MMFGASILVGSVVACSVLGGTAFKQFAVSREPVWLLAGLVAYNVSNIGWIALIGQSGLARASVMASSVSMIFVTAIAALYGERISAFHFAAVAFAICAVLLAALGDQHSTPRIPEHQIKQEDSDA